MIISSNPGLQWAQSYLNRLAALASPPTITATQRNAVFKLLSDIGATIDSTKFKAIYPFLGGTDTAHALNVVSSSFKITWNGGITHNASGVDGNGSTGYGDLGAAPSQLFSSQNSAHVFAYFNDNITGSLRAFFGASAGASGESSMSMSANSSLAFGLNSGYTNFNKTITNVYEKGGFGFSRGTPLHSFYKNGVFKDSENSIPNNASPVTNRNMYLLASNVNGTSGGHTSAPCAFASFGGDLTAEDHANLYKAVHAYQLALGRAA